MHTEKKSNILRMPFSSEIIKVLLLLLFTSTSILAEEFYISQDGTGSQSGSSPENAKPVSFLNSFSNWNSPTKILGKIGPGDSINLEGTITSTIHIQESGIDGSPITIRFSAGAKMQSPAWPSSTGAISVFLKDHITIDGNGEGIIENTNNGSELELQVHSLGIRAINSNNLTVKNITIRNIYVRSLESDIADQDTSCISNQAANGPTIRNFTVTNCILHDAFRGIGSDYGDDCSNYEFSYNTIYNTNHGAGCGHRGATSKLSGLKFHNNRVYNWAKWDNPEHNVYHHNGFFAFADHPGNLISNIEVHSNTFGPGYGNQYQTSGVYINGQIENINAYNNIFVCNPGEFAANGLVTLSSKRETTINIMNNTFIGGAAGTAIQLNGRGVDQTIRVINNLGNGNGSGTFIALYNNSPNITLDARNNLGYDYNSLLPYIHSSNGNGVFKTYEEWSSIFPNEAPPENPNLDSSLIPLQDSPAKSAGTNLSSYFTLDKRGNLRPSVWDIGAIQTPSSQSAPNQPTQLRINTLK